MSSRDVQRGPAIGAPMRKRNYLAPMVSNAVKYAAFHFWLGGVEFGEGVVNPN